MLTSAAYLLVFLPPAKPSTRLFPNDDPVGPEPERAVHEVFTLADVHAVPLSLELSQPHLRHLAAIMVDPQVERS